MPALAEITGRLGLDTNSFKQDLSSAKDQFRKFGQEIQSEGSKAGSQAGENVGGGLANALDHKLFGSRHIAGALATALGLNLEKIADKIASVIVGGTKEGFDKAIALEERISKALDERDSKRITALREQQSIQNQILAKQKEFDSIQGHHLETVTQGSAFNAPVTRLAAGGDLTAEQLVKQRTLTAEILELQNKLYDFKERDREDTKKFNEAQQEFEAKRYTGEQKIAVLKAQQQTLLNEFIKAGKTQGDVDGVHISQTQIRLKLLEKENQIQEETQKLSDKQKAGVQAVIKAREDGEERIKEFTEGQMSDAARLQTELQAVLDIEKEIAKTKKDTVEYAELINKKVDAEIKLARDLSNVKKAESKAGDEDKLTLQELASKDSFQSGVSVDIGSQGAQAREALKLKAQAEEARQAGNSDQAAELRSRFDTIRGGLTALKDGDRGPAAQFKEALAPTNTLLTQIDKTLGGKFKAQ